MQTNYQGPLEAQHPLLAGAIADGRLREIVTALNVTGQSKQIAAYTVGADPEEGDTYTVVINDISVTYTAGESPTVDTVAAGIAAAVMAEPLLASQVVATSASAVVTFTAVAAEHTFTIAVSSTGGSLTEEGSTAAGGLGSVVPFGAVVQYEGVSGANITAVRAGSGFSTAKALGVAVRTENYEQTSSPAGYPAGTSMSVMKRGAVVVVVDADVERGDSVYVYTTGDNASTFSATSGSGKTQVTTAKWERMLTGTVSGEKRAVLLVDFV